MLTSDIERFCRERNITDYIDGVLLFAEANNIDVEIIAEHINSDPLFKYKIQAEAENLNILKREGARLPI